MTPAGELTMLVMLAALLAFMISCMTPTEAPQWTSTTSNIVEIVEGVSPAQQKATAMSKIPDFSNYNMVRTLSAEEFPLTDPNRRVIMVGDIHGMYRPLTRLLTKLDYNPHSDVLIHTGDFLVKGLHHNSMATLDFMTLHNVTGVRGNHDQEVLEWKGWIDWICAASDGSEWLKRMERSWRHVHNDPNSFDLDHFLDKERNTASSNDKRWWKLIPAGWKFLSDPYRIARGMTKAQHEYLLSLPLALYIPSAHTFVAHAGILPSDPRYPLHSSRQPLAHIPGLSRSDSPDSVCSGSSSERMGCMERLRGAQELALLSDIPQNKVPWVLLNMRGIKRGKVFRKYKGSYWANKWNKEMRLCGGFNGGPFLEEEDGEVDGEVKPKPSSLPCYPSTIVYGHSAAMDFLPKRWAIGLDAGCVYGRKLTAVVLGGDTGLIDPEADDWTIDNGEDDEYESDDDEDDEDDEDDDDENDDQDNDGEEDIDSKKRRRTKKHHDGDTIRFGLNSKARIATIKCP